MDVGLDIINKQIPKADTEIISITINDHFITLNILQLSNHKVDIEDRMLLEIDLKAMVFCLP